MGPAKEFYFLTELRFLGSTARWHADRIRDLVRDWTSAQVELDAPETPSRPRLPGEPQGDFIKALVEEENQRTGLRQQQIDRSLNAQWELFARVDAFLALYGRIALVIFPQNEARSLIQSDRAAQLRSVLGIDTEHLISNKLLRNKWIHFDEVIDALPSRDVKPVTPQRFTRSEEVDRHRDNTLRLMVVDTLSVIYQGFGEFRLEEMFEAVKDVEDRAIRGIETWGRRSRES